LATTDFPPPSDTVLERLKALHPKLIDLSLGRIERLLAALDHPERRMAPAIHVAGTNGKGSTVAFLRAMLEAAGYRVHVYTSPHLVRFAERIRLAGRIIDEAQLTAILERCEQANKGQPITFFEVTTAAAFLAFAETPADVVLLETGLGGRLDATNVLDAPLACAITPVSMDHEQFLGDTLPQIAFEKAGILKRGVPAIISPQPPHAAAVIEARAREIGAPLSWHGRDWHIEGNSFSMVWQSGPNDKPKRRMALPRPALPGDHQLFNAGTAIATLAALEDFAVGESAIRTGLTTVEWPARLQRLTRGPLVEDLAKLAHEFELWLDGGHNPSAGEALATQAAQWRDKPLMIVTGMLRTKDAAGFLRPLAPRIAAARTVVIPGEEASLSAAETAHAAITAGIPNTLPTSTVDAAVNDLARSAGGPARILICGSLYLAGQVLAENG
jgi:dihydrofolate synthase/folylpolyglutamate synthase